MNGPRNTWFSEAHVLDYLRRAPTIPHREEGEAVLLELLPPHTSRVLDVGAGAGRLVALLRAHHPDVEIVALDVAPTMLEALAAAHGDDEAVTIVNHDLRSELPSSLGCFDAVVSSFAIHHLEDDRKRELYAEILASLKAGGVFCNLEHVSSPSPRLHEAFMARLGQTLEQEDRSNRLLDVDTQLGWLREVGFEEVDCYWKWFEFTLISGRRPQTLEEGV